MHKCQQKDEHDNIQRPFGKKESSITVSSFFSRIFPLARTSVNVNLEWSSVKNHDTVQRSMHCQLHTHTTNN